MRQEQALFPSPDPREVVAAADSEPAAFYSNARRAILDQVSGIGLAVVVIVELPGPLAGAVVMQRDQNFDPNQGSVALRRIDVVLVHHRSTGLRIDLGTGLHDKAA